MNIYIEKIVESIKNSKKPSGKVVKQITLDEELMIKYKCDDALTICYMIAKNIESIPLCECCNNKVSFKSTNKGFAKFCSVKCRMKLYNKQANPIKNSKKSIFLHNSRVSVLEKAAHYYLNNNVRIVDVAEKFNLSYNIIRSFLRKNDYIKNNNQKYFKSKNFLQSVDEKLLSYEFLKKSAEDGLSLNDVAKTLNVAANTVRLYALKHNIKFNSDSQAERELLEFMKQYDTNSDKTRKIISPYEIDIFSEKYNLGIELHGEYWHCEDRVDIQYHLKKQKLSESKNVKLIQIYSNEWADKKDIIKSMILSNMNISERIYARKLNFVELNKKVAKEFFNKNHLQGWLKCVVSYGLIDDSGEIYSAISFGKGRFNKGADYELLRYCNKLNYTIIGGFTKLMVNSQKKMNFKSLITYSHRRLFTGKVYEKFGFTKINETRPGYFWYNINTKEIRTRYSTQKHKLDTNLSEIEHMKSLGFRRVFDCGQNVYKYELSNTCIQER
jgi:hypothetical protein